MQKIKKTISLEEFKTRYPLTYPSLRGTDVSLITKSSIKQYINANYGQVPYGINENICGSYDTFTNNMKLYYGGKIIDYKTLEDWYKEFKEYYNLLYNNQCGLSYSSATHYYTSMYQSKDEMYYEYVEKDLSNSKHGGAKFYKWLTQNYFLSLDLRFTYKDMVAQGVSFDIDFITWAECVDNIGANILYYPTVTELLSQMLIWSKKFPKNNCSLYEDCCDCVEFYNKGGFTTIKILKYWLSKVEPNITNCNALVIKNEEEALTDKAESLSPKINIPILLKHTVADFGNYTIFSSEYDSSATYEEKDVCTYNDIVYILTGGTGHMLNTTTQKYEFNPNNWQGYFQYIKQSDEVKAKSSNDYTVQYPDYGPNYQLTGRTQSSLISFQRATKTSDILGNVLPGYFKASSGNTFLQPAEDTLLSLCYEPGEVINLQFVETGSLSGYTGDFLYQIILYYNNTDGNQINETVVYCSEGDDVLAKIQLCIDKANVAKEFLDIEDILHADFVYYKGAFFKYKANGTISIGVETINGVNYESGIKYIDHCTLEMKNTLYYLSTTEYYPVRYYDVIMDLGTYYSDSQGTTVEACMSDFSFYPIAFQKAANTEVGWADMVAAPLFRKEETLGLTLPEKITDNIYIDRGYTTVIDRHFKIGEVTSCDALEKYGNGSFLMISSTEDSVY